MGLIISKFKELRKSVFTLKKKKGDSNLMISIYFVYKIKFWFIFLIYKKMLQSILFISKWFLIYLS